MWYWRRLRRGLASPLEFVILLLLTEKPWYGYEIAQRLGVLFREMWIPNVGTIYHILHRLEKRKFVDCRIERRPDGIERKLYRINAAGKEALRKTAKEFRDQVDLIREVARLTDKFEKKRK